MIKKWVISLNRPYTEEIDYNIPDEDIIIITETENNKIEDELKKGGKYLTSEDSILVLKEIPRYSAEYYEQQEIDVNSMAQLSQTDWKVIRELERIFLADTELHQTREELRKKVQKKTPLIL